MILFQLVGDMGLEPITPIKTSVFKTDVYANFTNPPGLTQTTHRRDKLQPIPSSVTRSSRLLPFKTQQAQQA